MKKALALALVLLTALALTACGRQPSAPAETNRTQQEEDYRSEAEKYRDEALRGYELSLPYVSVVAFDEKTQAELDAIPEKLAIYQETFHVRFENPNDLTELLAKGAISNSKYDRHAVAGREDCPDELLVRIAKDDPDMVVRFRALGNILARDEFPTKFLLELAESEYAKTRLIAVMHQNCTPEIVCPLINDPDAQVKEQVKIALGMIEPVLSASVKNELDEFWQKDSELDQRAMALLIQVESMQSMPDEFVAQLAALLPEFEALREEGRNLSAEAYAEIEWYVEDWWSIPLLTVKDPYLDQLDNGEKIITLISVKDGSFTIGSEYYRWVKWADNVKIDTNNENTSVERHYQIIDKSRPAYLLIESSETPLELYQILP